MAEMSNIRKFVEAMDDLAFGGFDYWNPIRTTYTYKGIVVDPDKFDIVPKSAYKQELIEQKEARLKLLREEQEQIKKEIEELKQK